MNRNEPPKICRSQIMVLTQNGQDGRNTSIFEGNRASISENPSSYSQQFVRNNETTQLSRWYGQLFLGYHSSSTNMFMGLNKRNLAFIGGGELHAGRPAALSGPRETLEAPSMHRPQLLALPRWFEVLALVLVIFSYFCKRLSYSMSTTRSVLFSTAAGPAGHGRTGRWTVRRPRPPG